MNRSLINANRARSTNEPKRFSAHAIVCLGMLMLSLLSLFSVARPSASCAQEKEIKEPKIEPKTESPNKAKDLPSPKQVIEKHIVALGGYELLESRKTVRYHARASKSNEPFDYEVYIADGYYYSKYSYDNGRVFERGINQGVGWTRTNGSSRRIVGEELRDLLSRHKLLCPVTAWLDTHKKIEVIGRGVINDRDAYKLFFVNSEGYEKFRFFDVETGLILRTIAKEQYNTSIRHIVRDYSDYENMGDAVVPKTKRMKSNTVGSTTYRNYLFEIQSYEVDTKIPKGTFDLPQTIAVQVANDVK